ncbi:MAG TPA: PEP-utilizing enzyme [Syntrophorhabdus sp.]|nr:MAG: Chondramide synthase cmdD [Deltaproteobacteria bacterium ADurb.Bin135]HPW37026.1 PEP-utilizing enzyme [Syntrophorhabdus sp.]HQB35248.1 PEP-utilizing enzyme [Syntrophorhabdus sp.]HQP54927.1 PEP-utilizing enzyme [Syntrophorhabdus sp.]
MKIYDCVPGLEFDEKDDLEQSPAWFLDGTHSIPPWTPMFGWFWVNFCRHGMQYGAETLYLPRSKGWDWRFKNGGGYLTILLVDSEDEMKEREVKFRHAIRPFLENYDGLWDGFVNEMLGRYGKIKAVNGDTATNIELLANFDYAVETCRRMWEIHMYMMYGTYMPYVLFEQLCKHLLNIDDTHPDFHRLMSGFDNESFRVDRGLWEYAQKLKDMGLADVVVGVPTKEWEGKLVASEKGQEFLKDFKIFLDTKAGWRMERMAEINVPSWSEEPSQAFDTMEIYLKQGKEFDLDAKRLMLEKDRKVAEKEILERISPEQRGWFSILLKIAQNSSRFSEEHDHYLDLYCHSVVRKTCIDIGKRFAAGGAIAETDDIFFLIPDEVHRAGINPGKFNMKNIVARRKNEWSKWNETGNPPIMLKKDFGIAQAMEFMIKSMDPIALKVVVGKLPEARPDLKADLYGTCGSPGVAEGIARTVFKEEDLAAIQEGDILISVSTSPAWTPIFGMIRGVVVDRGGSLSHAAIVGREYGIPVVMNTFEGTAKIKSGQRIRIDANLGTVFILDK